MEPLPAKPLFDKNGQPVQVGDRVRMRVATAAWAKAMVSGTVIIRGTVQYEGGGPLYQDWGMKGDDGFTYRISVNSPTLIKEGTMNKRYTIRKREGDVHTEFEVVDWQSPQIDDVLFSSPDRNAAVAFMKAKGLESKGLVARLMAFLEAQEWFEQGRPNQVLKNGKWINEGKEQPCGSCKGQGGWHTPSGPIMCPDCRGRGKR